MKPEIIKKAVGDRSPQLCMLADAIDCGRGYNDGRSIWLTQLTYNEQCAALGLAALYPNHVRALVTHDLSSAEIKNIGDLVSLIRIGA